MVLLNTACTSTKPMLQASKNNSEDVKELVNSLYPGKIYQFLLHDGRRITLKFVGVNDGMVTGIVKPNTKPNTWVTFFVSDISQIYTIKNNVAGTILVVVTVGVFIFVVMLIVETANLSRQLP